MSTSRYRIARTVLISAFAVGCSGDILGLRGDDGLAPELDESVANEVATSGVRRLTAAEYDAVVLDLLGVDAGSETSLPEDPRTPFDNDYTKQVASEALVNSVASLAGEVVPRALGDAALRARIVPCSPDGSNDEACFDSFVASFGRLALRRSLPEAERERYKAFLPQARGDFWVAVDSALRVFLQHPEFLYRIEVGQPVAGREGVFRLSDYELATRLSFVLWGSTPPSWLLDEAEQGGLSDAQGVRDAASRLLDDDRAKAQVARFHALWMSYERLPHGETLSAAMREETNALLNRILFEEKRPWSDLLRIDETFLTPELAAHYGLPAPPGNAPGWVAYGDSGRRGLLSHGSFLSAGAKFADTSPTQRGLLIRTRLFCQTINHPPPDLMVDTDAPPEGSDPNACKPQRYNMWQQDGCKGCHALMDPVGFGLEHFDPAGRYRETEAGRPDCVIEGKGELSGVGAFSGPAELSDLMLQTGELDQCLTRQFYRFMMGRFDLDSADTTWIRRAREDAAGGAELGLIDFVLEMVSSEAFRHRREEAM